MDHLVESNNGAEERALARHKNESRHQNIYILAGSISLSIDNVVLGPILKRLLITMIKNADLNVSLDNNR
jgi:hypothetical protein